MKSLFSSLSRKFGGDSPSIASPTAFRKASDQNVLVAKQIRTLISNCTAESSEMEKERVADNIQCILRASEDPASILCEVKQRDLLVSFISDLVVVFRRWVSQLLMGTGLSTESKQYSPCVILPALCEANLDFVPLVLTSEFLDSVSSLLLSVKVVSTVSAVLSILRFSIERSSSVFRDLNDNLDIYSLYYSLHPGLVDSIFTFLKFIEDRLPHSTQSPTEIGSRFFSFVPRYSIGDISAFVRLCHLCLTDHPAVVRFFSTNRLYQSLKDRVMTLAADGLEPGLMYQFAESMRILSSTVSPFRGSSSVASPRVVSHVNVMENLVSIFIGIGKLDRMQDSQVEILESISNVFKQDPSNCNLAMGNAILFPVMERFSSFHQQVQTKLIEIVLDFFSVNNESRELYDLFTSKITSISSMEMISPFIQYLNYHLKDSIRMASFFSDPSLIRFLLQLYNHFFIQGSIWSNLQGCPLRPTGSSPETKELLMDTVHCYFKAFSVPFFEETQNLGFYFIVPISQNSFIIHRFYTELSKDPVGVNVLTRGLIALLEHTTNHFLGPEFDSFMDFWLSLPASFTSILARLTGTSIWKSEFPRVASKLVEVVRSLLVSPAKDTNSSNPDKESLIPTDLQPYRIIVSGLAFVHRLPRSEDILPIVTPFLGVLQNRDSLLSSLAQRALLNCIMRASFVPLLTMDELMDFFVRSLNGRDDMFPETSSPTFAVLHGSLIEFLLRLFCIMGRQQSKDLSSFFEVLFRLVYQTYNEIALSAFDNFTYLMQIYVEFPLPKQIKSLVLKMIQSLGEYGIPQDALVYWYKMVQNSNYPAELFECIMSITGSQSSLHYLFSNCPQVSLNTLHSGDVAWIELPPFFSYTKWESINGVSYSSWFCIRDLAEESEVMLLSLTGVEQKSSVNLVVREHSLYFSTRSTEEMEVSEASIQYGLWYHLAFTLSKKKMNRSVVDFYLNGIQVDSLKCTTPSTLGHGGFIGIREEGSAVEMRQGVLYLFQICLTKEEVCSLYALGPCYYGYFCGLFGNSMIGISQDVLTPRHYSILQLDQNSHWTGATPECQVSFPINSIIYGYSAASMTALRENGYPTFRMSNCQPNLEPAATIHGEAVPIRSSLLSRTLRGVSDGGILYCLTIIEGSKKTSELNCGVVLLLRALHSDSWNRGIMEQRRGFFALSYLLMKKNHEALIDEGTVRYLFAFMGLEGASVLQSDETPLNLNLHLLFIVFSYYVLLNAPISVQKEFYHGCQSILDRLITHSSVPIQSSYLKRLTSYFLYPLTQHSFPSQLYPEVMKCIEGVLAVCKDRTVLQMIADFVVSSTSVHFGNTSHLSMSQSQRLQYSDSIVKFRDLLLNIILEIPDSNCDPVTYAKVVTHEWIFLLLGTKKAPSSQHIALQIYRRLLLSNPDPLLQSGSMYYFAISLPVLSAFKDACYGRFFLYELLMMAWGIPFHRRDYLNQSEILSAVPKRIGMKSTCPYPQFLYPIIQYMCIAYRSVIRQLNNRSQEMIVHSIRVTIKEVVSIIKRASPGSFLPYVMKDSRVIFFLMDILYSSLGSFSQPRPQPTSHFRRMRSRSTYDLIETRVFDTGHRRSSVFSGTENSILDALEFDNRFAEKQLLSDEVIHTIVNFLAHVAIRSLPITGTSPPLLESILNYVPSHYREKSRIPEIIRMHSEIIRELIGQLYDASETQDLLSYSQIVSIIVDRTLLYCYTPQGVASSPLLVGRDYFPNGPLIVTHIELKFAESLIQSKTIQINSSQLSVFQSRFTDLIVSYFDYCKQGDSLPTLSLLEVMAAILTQSILPTLNKTSVSLILYSVLCLVPSIEEEKSLCSCYEIITCCLDLMGPLKEEICSIKIGSALKQNLLTLIEKGINGGIASVTKWMGTHSSHYFEHIHDLLGPVWMDFKSEIKQKRKNDWDVQNGMWEQVLDDRVRFLSSQPYSYSYLHRRRMVIMAICNKEAARQVRANKNELHWMQFSAKSWNELKSSIGYPLARPAPLEGDYFLDFYENPSRIRLRLRRSNSKIAVSKERIEGEDRSTTPTPVASPVMAVTPRVYQHQKVVEVTRRSECRSNSFSFAIEGDPGLMGDESSAFQSSHLSEVSSSEAVVKMSTLRDRSCAPSFLPRESDQPLSSAALCSDSESPSSRSRLGSSYNDDCAELDDMNGIPKDTSSMTGSDAIPFSSSFEIGGAPLSPSDANQDAPYIPDKKSSSRRRMTRIFSEHSDTPTSLDGTSVSSRAREIVSARSVSVPVVSDFEEKVSPFIRPMDSVLKHHNCKRINGMNPIDALLIFTSNAIYTIDGFQCGQCTNNLNCKTQEVESQEHLMFRWVESEVSWIHYRKYELREVAMEVFMSQGYNIYLVFKSSEDRVEVERDIKKYYRSVSPLFDTPSNVNQNLQSLTSKWMNYEITNFEYLIHLNSFAGRSYNDLSQYMVFPWILSDYTSANLDFSDPRVFRDLRKPMGALFRETLFRERFESLKDIDEHPFHYGTHYSTAPIVNYYLTRLEPFASSLVSFQSGVFDNPTRMFRSVQKAWISSSGGGESSTDLQDVKELIPEFFTLPSFLLNINGYPLGSVNGEVINDVELPPWAHKKAREFIRVNRLALESEHTSLSINHWIDLIFGYKQRGRPAEDACNVFYYLTYEGAIDIDSVLDPSMRESILAQIREFGQTPSQLFSQAHPSRPPPAPDRSLGNWRLLIRSPIAPSFVRQQGISTCDKRVEGNYPRSISVKVGSLKIIDGKVCSIPQFSAFAGDFLDYFIAWGYKDCCLRLMPLCEPEGLKGEQSFIIMESLDSLAVVCCAFSNDSDLVAIAYENKTISLFKFCMASGDPESLLMEHQFTMYGHTDPVVGMSICTDFGVIISYSSTECFVWDISTARLVTRLEHDEKESIRCMSYSRFNCDILLCGSSFMYLYDVNGFPVCKLAISNCSAITSCEITLDSEYHPFAITGHENGAILLWIVDIVDEEYTFVQKDSLQYHHSSITAVHSSRMTLYSADEEAQIVQWARG